MQRTVNSFIWYHGWQDRWQIVGGPAPFYITYRGGEPQDGAYDPFGPEGKTLHSDFAALAQLALRKQREHGFKADAYIEAGGVATTTMAPMGDQVAVEQAEEIAEVRAAVLRFVQTFGVPSLWPHLPPAARVNDAYPVYPVNSC